MRRALRILAIMCLGEAVLAVLFEAWQFNQRYDLLLGLLVLLVAALGITLAISSVVAGAIAAAQGHQVGWLIGMITAGLFILVGPIVAGVISPLLVAQPSADPACQATGLPAQCQATSVQVFFQNLPLWVALASPALVGLVVLFYSSRMKEQGKSSQ